jgi:hypothetical protein
MRVLISAANLVAQEASRESRWRDDLFPLERIVIDRTDDQLRESALMTGSAQIHRAGGSPKASPINPDMR